MTIKQLNTIETIIWILKYLNTIFQIHFMLKFKIN